MDHLFQCTFTQAAIGPVTVTATNSYNKLTPKGYSDIGCLSTPRALPPSARPARVTSPAMCRAFFCLSANVCQRTETSGPADFQRHQAVTHIKKNATPNKIQIMTTKNLTSEITKQLINCGIKIIELPGGCVQLLGKYGSIILTHDVSTLRRKHLEQLCGVV